MLKIDYAKILVCALAATLAAAGLISWWIVLLFFLYGFEWQVTYIPKG